MIVNCAVYRQGATLADIPIADISDYVLQPDCFVWVAVRDPGRDELEVLQDEFGLHDLAVEDAHRGHQRPKIEEYGSALFLVVRTRWCWG